MKMMLPVEIDDEDAPASWGIIRAKSLTLQSLYDSVVKRLQKPGDRCSLYFGDKQFPKETSGKMAKSRQTSMSGTLNRAAPQGTLIRSKLIWRFEDHRWQLMFTMHDKTDL